MYMRCMAGRFLREEQRVLVFFFLCEDAEGVLACEKCGRGILGNVRVPCSCAGKELRLRLLIELEPQDIFLEFSDFDWGQGS